MPAEVVSRLPDDDAVGAALRNAGRVEAGASLRGGVVDQGSIRAINLKLREEVRIVDVADRDTERVARVDAERIYVQIANIDRAQPALTAGKRSGVDVGDLPGRCAEQAQGVDAVEVVGGFSDDGIVSPRLCEVL